MTLTIYTEEDAQRQMAMTIEVPEARVQQALQQKIRKLSREVHIPGFRKGKVPPQVLIRRVGADSLRAETIEELLPAILEEALTEANISPFDLPKVEDLAIEPLVMKLTIPLAPEVTLGNYRAIRREIPVAEVKEEAVAEALDQLRQRHAVIEPVDRPVELADMARLELSGTTTAPDGEEALFIEKQEINVIVDPEILMPGTPLAENIMGLSANESKEIRFTLPEDFEEAEIAGHDAVIQVTVKEVSRRELPELDDELAKIEGEHETLEELRQSLREGLQEQAEEQVDSDLLEGMVDSLEAGATMNYPPAAVEKEIDRMLESLKQRVAGTGWKWDDYVQTMADDEAGLRDQWRERAEAQLRRNLVFGEFIRQEKLQIAPADIEVVLNRRLARFEDESVRQHMRQLFAGEEGMQVLASDVLLEKVKDRVKEIITGNAPDLAALASADEEE